jgi:hypothetical protein
MAPASFSEHDVHVGSALCPRCGTPRPADAKFCGRCGLSFGSTSSPGPQAPDPGATIGPGVGEPAGPGVGAASGPGPAAPPPPPPPPPGPPGPPPPPDRERRTAAGWDARRWAIVGGGLAAVIVAVVLILVLAGNEEAAAGEIFLEPAASTGRDPFTVDVSQGTPSIGAAATPSPAAPVGASPGAIQSTSGATPGLYGGTQDNSSCNRNQLIEFLQQNADKARAWVDALNSDTSLRWSGGNRLTPDQIGSYINELTPAVLRGDTRVRNHGFSGGRPTPIEQILQASTAVLIDQFGVPRARCACGNPLALPRPTRGGTTYRGPRWPGFSPTTVVVVQPSPTIIIDFTFVNIVDGTQFGRPAGTDGGNDGPPPGGPGPTPSPTFTVPPDVILGEGDVQVTLLWGGTADLDLHVRDPNNEEIYFGARTSSSGGSLDHDDTAGTAAAHVENIFWPQAGAPSGSYEAWVVNYGGGVTESFELRIVVGGQVVYSQGGSLDPGASSEHVPFSR